VRGSTVVVPEKKEKKKMSGYRERLHGPKITGSTAFLCKNWKF
jgi:hypothetical protein